MPYVVGGNLQTYFTDLDYNPSTGEAVVIGVTYATDLSNLHGK